MSKSTKNSSKSTEKKVTEVVEEQAPVEDNLSVHSSGSESEDEIEGLSSADEAEDGSTSKLSTHQIKKLNKKKESKKKDSDNDQYSNIIYVSRLPQGFHERELNKYFSQFGDLIESRLARNKKSGNSRHYGFVEFVNKEDAKIAQETMNNYLLMGHLLQVRLLAKGSKIEKLYRYKKRVFAETPVKKSSKELKEKAKANHEKRVNKLTEAGITFKW
ncbi:hypothetical protein TBLA_0C05600 [Henningerozyma blattae CBS 6284]|uniref:RRM domain-containing protein n=1 Tax=Henningerozyma blattae (strain ATCC 34711 / CBS 6284 / DSM 70876 / NBRC 10599 / NRRL Y-10934 / UCD 77-7) TaxID=1071380 RepID=I2H1V6_HENB6|nr:hypothetical protein TBLA_0C05600 [Tetrapisispora blattae CBS 6284]CCH60358.1 hypothetical protein TBLA_0C05600 [Tetrapisispora blattae CBS 6284]